MIDCPECWHQFHSGNKCPACGHVIPGAVAASPLRDGSISEAQRSSDAWLIRQGIVTEDMTSEERKQAIHDYRKSILKKPRKVETDPRAWAREVLERDSPGFYEETLAKEALASISGDDE